jgi:triacylglycerol esterase/lipase EstA (alpha/beta hydrolase family)
MSCSQSFHAYLHLSKHQQISFIGHGIGGLYARYAILRMDERALLGPRLTPENFITFGTPHLGSLTVGAGVVSALKTQHAALVVLLLFAWTL